MTDKVQKIREKVEIVINRRLNLLNGDYFDLIKEADGFTNEIMNIINSLQEESVSEDLTTNKDEYISWSDMSEEEKAEFFMSDPFKIKNYE